jgi:hypothetical protein
MITIEMEKEAWELVVNLLAEHPFKQVAPLINNMMQQCNSQLQSQPNGADKTMQGQERITN